MFSSNVSLYQRALGADFHRLHPTLRRYFGALPDDAVGRGAGTYAQAGSRLRVARPVLVLLARRDVLFPEHGRDVPFTIENRRDGDELTAVRAFRFAGVDRRMRDRMAIRGDRLVDRIGRRGGLEVSLTARVEDGGMRLASTALAWRVRSLRLPLPHLARVTVSESAIGERQRVDVRVRMPLIGEVFRYAGDFAYRIHAAEEDVGRRP